MRAGPSLQPLQWGHAGFLFCFVFLSEPFPCGKLTQGRKKRSVAHTSEDLPQIDVLEQYDPGDLEPTKNPFHLLNLNNTEISSEKNENSVIRIIGGRDCKDGECPWQVTAKCASVSDLDEGPVLAESCWHSPQGRGPCCPNACVAPQQALSSRAKGA